MDIDIKAKQIPAEDQKVVLRTLAESVARQGCKFLEIGSWCGDSTIVLGNIAKKYGGHLFCVDWWKGNVGIDLEEIASRVDVFSYFWKRICSEGLEDVVIPIRGRSDIVSEILKTNVFDLVFIDGDHRYEGVFKDIQQYAPLVRRNKGILCGHDCEGRISDYDMGFLESGRDLDAYESVHCAVVLAVGSAFTNYSINCSVWSVRANERNSSWEPTNLLFPGIVDKRQLPPYPIGYSKNYEILRYGRLVYAVPHSLTNFDVTEIKALNHPEVITTETTQELENLIDENVYYSAQPELLGPYKGYNFVKYNDRIYALSTSLGPLDIPHIEESKLKEFQESGKGAFGKSIDEVKNIIDQLVPLVPVLVEESYNGFNFVFYKGKYYGVSQDLGPIDFTQIDEAAIKEYENRGKCVIGNSHIKAKQLVDHILDTAAQKSVNEEDKRIGALTKDVLDRDESIRKLTADIEDRDRKLHTMQGELEEEKRRTETLTKNVLDRDESIRKLTADIEDRDRMLHAMQGELEEAKRRIEALQKELIEIKSNRWYRLIEWRRKNKVKNSDMKN
ncbi:class I SAM-dependent methyltransferase [bacterium]|nr:class I SAM-dependent methyltransferase [bacterium]